MKGPEKGCKSLGQTPSTKLKSLHMPTTLQDKNGKEMKNKGIIPKN